MKNFERAIAAYIRRLKRWDDRLVAAAEKMASPVPDPLCTTTLRDTGWAILSPEFGLPTKTRQRYFLDLYDLVETALRFEEGFEPRDHRAGHYGDKWHAPLTPDDYPMVCPVLLTQLGPKILDKYQQAHLAWYGGKSDDMPARNTAASQIANAKAVFSPAHVEYFQTKCGLVIPRSIESFRKGKCYKLKRRDQTPPLERHLLAGHFAVRALLVSNRVLFRVVLLAFFVGLTREEIIHANRKWVVETEGGLVLRVWPGTEMQRDVPLLPHAARVLCEETGYLIEGDTEPERAKRCNDAVDYLRQHGFGDSFLPLKELEECFAWYIASCGANHSEARVAEIMGRHTSTVQRFLLHRLSDERCRLWEGDPLTAAPNPPSVP